MLAVCIRSCRDKRPAHDRRRRHHVTREETTRKVPRVSTLLVTMAVPTTDGLRAYWDSFAVDFERDVEQEVIPVTRGMFSSLGLHS